MKIKRKAIRNNQLFDMILEILANLFKIHGM